MVFRTDRLFIAATLAILPTLAHAAIVATDNFESYTAGAQLESGAIGSPGTGLNGGTGFTSAYNIDDAYKNTVTVANTGLSYTNGAVSITGGARSVTFTANSGTNPVDNLIFRQFSGQSGPIYFSFLFRTNNPTTDEDFVQIGLSSTTGEPRASLGISGTSAGLAPSKFFARIPNGSGNSVFSSTNLQPDTTYFIVGKVTKSATTYNNIALYLNPSTLTEPATPLVSRTGDTALSSLNSLDIRVARLESTDAYQIDNLTISTTYADVIPEPATLTLASAAFSLLALRRRPAQK